MAAGTLTVRSTVSLLVYGWSGASMVGASPTSGTSLGVGLPATDDTWLTNPPNPRATDDTNGPTWPLPTHRIVPPSTATDTARNTFMTSGRPRRRSIRR